MPNSLGGWGNFNKSSHKPLVTLEQKKVDKEAFRHILNIKLFSLDETPYPVVYQFSLHTMKV